MLRALCLSALTVTTMTGAGLGSAHATAPATRATAAAVTVASCSGRPLAGNVLAAGSCVVVHARGFAAGESVRVRQLSAPHDVSGAVADNRGMVTYRLTVRHRTSDVLTLVGLGGTDAKVAGRAGNLTVSVPRFAILRYRIR